MSARRNAVTAAATRGMAGTIPANRGAAKTPTSEDQPKLPHPPELRELFRLVIKGLSQAAGIRSDRHRAMIGVTGLERRLDERLANPPKDPDDDPPHRGPVESDPSAVEYGRWLEENTRRLRWPPPLRPEAKPERTAGNTAPFPPNGVEAYGLLVTTSPQTNLPYNPIKIPPPSEQTYDMGQYQLTVEFTPPAE